MIKTLLLFLLPFTLYSSNILSYNIYDRTDRVDVMLTFDTPYKGQIKQTVSKSKIIIKLDESNIDSSKLKKLSSKFLHSLTITPMLGHTQIIATVPPNTHLTASKTSDAYGLRLRFNAKTPQNEVSNKKTNPLALLPTKADDDMSQSYYTVVGILIVGILILLFIKKKVTPNMSYKNEKNEKTSWLSGSKESKQYIEKSSSINEVNIRFQKSIDEHNSVVMLDYGVQSYFILMSNNGNIVLDKFTDNKPATQEDFESILQSRNKELDNFLNKDEEVKDPIQVYKEKAASISYGA